MAKTNPTHKARIRRKLHIRKRVHGTSDRPRLCVFRSAKHIYCQLINDEEGSTIASASSLKLKGKQHGGNCEGARSVGKNIATAAKKKKVQAVVFDRNGYLYHGRVAALADAAREAGLKF
jgi:large subunit ribosomal protein L18